MIDKMKKATYFVQPAYLDNKIFDLNNRYLNRDNCLACYAQLKNIFAQRGIDLSTQDINMVEDADFVIYHDLPKTLPKNEHIYKSFLIIFESAIIRKDNWQLDNHKYFNKIFTWDDSKVDNKKYFKLNYSHDYHISPYFDQIDRTGFCTMISGNKLYSHPNELYSERLKVINWFEMNAPELFDYYGMGWEMYYFSGILKKLNRFTGLRKLLRPKLGECYKGAVKHKIKTLSQYRFCICYENGRDISGYITEKIFDCFMAGTIPIYWGAPNIKDHVPENCFIDRREFNTMKELVTYMQSLSILEIDAIRNNILDFINSDKIYPYTCEYFTETLVREVIDG